MLNDQVALVTGASRGIGQAIARALEAGQPSKQHVLNCLSRLAEPRRPQPLKPPATLKLVNEPKADTVQN